MQKYIKPTLPKPIVRSSLTLNKSHKLFQPNNVINNVSNQIVQVSPPIDAGAMLGICVISIVALCCSTYAYCAVERSVACCATHHTAIATLTKDAHKTVFSYRYSTFDDLVIPFGLMNALNTFI